jgi:uncharacterized protein (DUF302 family)
MPSIVFSARPACGFDDAVARTIDALKAQGFGVITDVDIAATLKAKLGVERPPYRILGACAPSYAMQALDADPHVGALLPCNVVVRQDAATGQVIVDFMNPQAVLGLIDASAIAAVADAVTAKLTAVRDSLDAAR